MKLSTTLLGLFFLGASQVHATPVKEDLEKRRHGCYPFFEDDPTQCRFHCINDVLKNCGNGNYVRPVNDFANAFTTQIVLEGT
ncbi:hypothetical protein AJ80_00350 [Polytolypa hystricis UAMH7299]|uniref:Uncharacterized protein n=1 Tax=Polytolypa hystricis (strain UAMH7299) TaxID=1447883 RepID=A0A2B7Z4X4_POLH7|nr:hypothetical protein AJ80_00350 [Polytolypa hystricis UAMH7299]